MSVNNGYYKTEVEFDKEDKNVNNVDSVAIENDKETPQTYDEALDIAGTGCYTWYLMVTSSLSLFAMIIDMFGYSVVVTGSQCEFELGIYQKSALLSMPFVGSIFSSYVWGYLSDTRGRRRCQLWALWISCTISLLGALSPNYIVSGILRFISTSFCSCAQSTSYVLLGESSSRKVRDAMMVVMTGILDIAFAVYMVLGYLILNANISISIFGINILPWRILTVVLALPLGITALLLHFVYESPKFLANKHGSEEALMVLRKIWKRNGNRGEYPVKLLVLNEEGNIRQQKTPLLESLWQQTAPLFKPPLLWRTLQLYYLITIPYSIGNSLSIWLPHIMDTFFNGVNLSSGSKAPEGLCPMISQANDLRITANVTCTATIELNTMYMGIALGMGLFFVIMVFSIFAARKKLMTVSLSVFCCACGVGMAVIPNNIASLVMLFGIELNNLTMGILFAYFVDLYPTSHRGMASGLGIIVARISSLAGVNVIGPYIISHCSVTVYGFSAYMFSGIMVSLLLPPDNRVNPQP